MAGTDVTLSHRYVVEQRRAKVAQFKKAGLSQRQIAEQLQVSVGTINGDLQALVKRWRREQLLDIHDEMLLDLQRIDDIIVALTDDVRKGSLAHIDTYMRLLKRRAEIIGYDAAKRVTHEFDDMPIPQLLMVIISQGGPVVQKIIDDAPEDANVIQLLETHAPERPEVRALLARLPRS